MRIGGVALRAVHGQRAGEAAAAADLDHVAERRGIGRLADDAGVEPLAARLQPVEHLARAVDRDALLVAGDEEADRAAEIRPARGEEARHRGGEAGDGALHVGGAAAAQHAVDDAAGEGRDRPARGLAGRHHVGVAGEAEIAPAIAEPCIEVDDVGGALFGEDQTMTGEAEALEPAGEEIDRALVARRHARQADELAGEGDRVDEGVGERHAGILNRAGAR